MFTNALLSTPDITSLIRDTEPHERALFSVPPPQPPASSSASYTKKQPNRRQTVFNVASGEVTTGTGTSARAPRRNTAIAAVLGPELHSEVRKSEGKGDVDIEVLLRGAEKLNEVYSILGVPKRIDDLRLRYSQLSSSVAHYEQKVANQERELDKMNRNDVYGDEDFQDEDTGTEPEEKFEITDEDLKREEEEIKDLERRKKELEDRVSGMERDLGGLLR